MPFSAVAAVVALVLAAFAAPASAGVVPSIDTTIDSGPAQYATVTSDPTFTFSGAGTGFECSVDGAAWTDCSSGSYTATGLADANLPLNTGGHTFQVRSTVAGTGVDPSPASRTFIFDVQDAVHCTIKDENGSTVAGTTGDDVICIGGYGSTVDGGAGKDAIIGGPGVDVIDGGTGDDAIWGGPGDDDLDGGNTDVAFDRIDGAAGADTINGGPGIDRVMYDRRTAGVTVTLDGTANDGEAGEGDNVATDVESVTGGNGADSLTGNDEPNTFSGRGGNDTMVGGLGDDFMGGGAGADDFSGGEGTASLDRVTYSDYGADKPVTVTLDDNANDGAAGEGDNVRADIEYVYGGAGNDTISAPTTRTTGVSFWGNAGDDTLTSGAGSDALYGGSGVDTLSSNDGNDIVRGNTQSDKITCGNGTGDQYEFDYATPDRYGNTLSRDPAAGGCEVEIDPIVGQDKDGDGDIDQVDCAPYDPDINSGAVDHPDLGLADTNCDGIDGNRNTAIFVSPTGNDANNGTTPALAAKTINGAIGKASAAGRNEILIAAGTYDEGTNGAQVKTGVSLFGGYAAGYLSRSLTANVATITGSPQGVLADNDQNVKIQVVSVRSTADNNRSAYGVRAINGSSITLERADVRSGDGAAGGDGNAGAGGVNGETGSAGGAGSKDGATPGNGGGGGGGSGKAAGGGGGKGGAEGSNKGATGGTGTASNAGAGGGGGGGGNGGNPGARGSDGGAGTNGQGGGNGSGGTFAFGNITTWTATGANGGGDGQNGAGGGGGGGGGGQGCTFCNDGSGSGGGGGGSGAIGGKGGAAGAFGGGSFGVFLNNSTLAAISGTVIVSGAGGKGGNGGNGGGGATGGNGGAGGSAGGEVGDGGTGGKGGNSGAGGAGGGGAGGPSIGVLRLNGATATTTGSTVTPGTAGARGTSAGNNGQVGVSVAIQ